jgi:oxygen-independent coproporphyrinogen-3 oxidase
MLIKRRIMLHILENIFYEAGYYRSSVWAFTKKGIEKYCSVTVPLYIGLGASGGSYLKNFFFVNTFNVAEYIRSIEKNIMPTALSINLSLSMQMAGWLYWRLYETRLRKSNFYDKFKLDFNKEFGKLMSAFRISGLLKDHGDDIVLTNRGSYWLHAFEDYFSIDFISKLWGNSRLEPWPEKVVLLD